MASPPTPSFRLSSSQTALALVVPSHLQPEINTLRKIHDKAYRKWEPHINVLYPFVEASLLSSAVSVLRAYLSAHQISPFKVKIEEVGTFEHRRNATVFLKAGEESEEKICDLRKQLVDALGRDEGEGTHDGVFRPHLTIGQAALSGLTMERLIEKVGRLVGLEWDVERLVVLRREATGEMTAVDEIWLRDSDGGEDENASHFVGGGWRMCFHFTAEDGWTQLPRNIICPSSNGNPSIVLTIASYNLMSEPHAPQFPTRLPHIVEAISKSILQSSSLIRVLCLQEVDEQMLPLLLEDPVLQELFPFSTHSPSSIFPSRRNLVTLSSDPFSCYTVQFAERHKSALVISFCELLVQVVNVHLTSALTDEAVAAKKSQLKILTNFIKEAQTSDEKNVFAAGDFNLTTSSKTIETALSQKIITLETAQSVREMIDTEYWDDAFVAFSNLNKGPNSKEIYEGEEGATFDRLNNPLASISKTVIDNRPQRYDRVLFKRGAQVQPLHFEIFGRPTEDRACFSDHYGIGAILQIQGMKDAELRARTVPASHSVERIKIIEDSTDIQALISSFLPTEADRKQREDALALLQKTLTQSRSLKDLIFAPLGSYCMDTYFADSDVDVLAIASVSPQLFFDFATEQLKALDTGDEGEDSRFKGVHFVNSLVSIIEVNILGIKFDIQYCQAPELLERYHKHPQTLLKTLVFDPNLLKTLNPTSLRPLNTYRDTIYLLTSLPHLRSYRLAHRFLALYLKSRGLYSVKFSYLGGIHVSLLLNRIVKLITSQYSSKSAITVEISLSPATIIRTFFNYYSNFPWATKPVVDPDLENGNGNQAKRTPRDALFIPAPHTPTARPNIASSCTPLSTHTLTTEFSLAATHLSQNNWAFCIRPASESRKEFLGAYDAYIRIEIQVWDLQDFGRERGREVLGGVERSVLRVLLSLGAIGGLGGRAWPARFCCPGESAEENGNAFKGYYLVGVSVTEADAEKKKMLGTKVRSVVREFESMVRGVREVREGTGNVWVGVDIVSRKRVGEMGLVVDERDWGSF